MTIDEAIKYFNIPQWDKVLEDNDYTEDEKNIISGYAKRINSGEQVKDVVGAFNYLYGSSSVFCDPITEHMIVCSEAFGRVELQRSFSSDLKKRRCIECL